jgi:hypothetical protein
VVPLLAPESRRNFFSRPLQILPSFLSFYFSSSRPGAAQSPHRKVLVFHSRAGIVGQVFPGLLHRAVFIFVHALVDFLLVLVLCSARVCVYVAASVPQSASLPQVVFPTPGLSSFLCVLSTCSVLQSVLPRRSFYFHFRLCLDPSFTS